MSILVSFIMPVYNAERTLRTAVESVLNQTESQISLIAVDDGSVDSSSEISSEIAYADARVVFCCKQNKGVSNTRNIGIALSKDDYISFIDSDDLLETQFVELCCEPMRKYPIDLCAAGYQMIVMNKASVVEKKEWWIKSPLLPCECIIIRKDIEDLVLKTLARIVPWDSSVNIFCSCWGKIFRRRLIVDNSLEFNENRIIAEDWQFMIEYLAKVRCIYLIDKSLYRYMRYDGFSTLSHRVEVSQFEISIWWHSYLRALFPHWNWNKNSDMKSYTEIPMSSMQYYFEMLFYSSSEKKTLYREKQQTIYRWCLEHKQELRYKNSAFPVMLSVIINMKSFLLFRLYTDTYCVLTLYGWKKLIYDHKCILQNCFKH